MNNDFFKLPRLNTDRDLKDKTVIALSESQAHYLYNVLRRKNGDQVRLFNTRDGEWIGTIENLSKKTAEVMLTEQRLKQPNISRRVHLLFAPIKKNRMEWLIEKAVELGVTDFHPVITQNTEVRKIKEDRVKTQIFEAVEQCERFHVPTLHTSLKLDQILKTWPSDIDILACLERYDGQKLKQNNSLKDVAILIGPEGGFTAAEKEKIAKHATSITLGDQILRSETAALKVISVLTA